MSTTTRTFFAGVNERQVRVPPRLTGTLRFDVRFDTRQEHWLIRFADGTVHAEESDAPADCVATIDGALFERVLRGEERLTTAFVRYAFTIEGMFVLLPGFEWLLPDMVGARHPRQLAQGWKAAR